MKHLTMSDVARLSGYSRLTVSLALGNKPGVSDRARAHILAISESHGYRPNLMAQALKNKRSNLIGVIVRDITNPYYGELIRGIERAAAAQGCVLLNMSTHESHDREVAALHSLSAYQVDGVILAPVLRGVDVAHIRAWRRTPLITVEKIPGAGIDHVRFDDVKGGYLATGHLLARGHRRICYLEGPPTAASSADRLKGMKRCLKDHGIPWTPAMSEPAGATVLDGYTAAKRILAQRKPRPTAIFAFCDLVAAGAYKAAQALGLRIPEDLSVVGYDDIDLAPVLGPGLTTVRFGMDAVGEFVAEQLLGAIAAGKLHMGLKQFFKPVLVERDSVQSCNEPAKRTARKGARAARA
ncbi:MAG: LacI family DNA-binding transcriptional regulator [Candidatus Hydrogenedentes bacterium]|nr:LacI family DNA-binding transcriptional regulator [Candidatus Hydrogenedentota bacterium]